MAKPQTDLALSSSQTDVSVAPKPTQAPSVGSMLQAVIEKGVSADNIGAVEKLVALYERMEDKEAEKEFARAFVLLQAEMQKVKATSAVPNRDGSVRYHFAPFQEIMQEVGPRLKAHGFTVMFSTKYDGPRLVKICTLTHVGGHSRQNEFAVRIGQGPPGSTESQADGAASTYAKRGALCDALNIVIDHDTDARAEGGAITKEQAAELKKRVHATGSDEPRFLKYAGAESYETISAVKFDMLDELLRKREKP